MLLLEETKKIRVESEKEAQEIIEEYRTNQKNGYDIKKATYERKIKKSKGEIIGEAYLVTVVLTYTDFWYMEEGANEG